MKCNQRDIKKAIASGEAVDLTTANSQKIDEIRAKEDYFIELKYSVGIYGCNGRLMKGRNTGTIYGVGDRTPALWLTA